nr:unnamed protein product [Callosobruchus chinensis]
MDYGLQKTREDLWTFQSSINAGLPQGSVLAPTLLLLYINDLLSSTTNPIHSFADDSTLHAGTMSNRPISVVERRRLPTAASLSKDLEDFSPSNLLTLYKAQIRPNLEYC